VYMFNKKNSKTREKIFRGVAIFLFICMVGFSVGTAFFR
jgi:hypothetical protein